MVTLPTRRLAAIVIADVVGYSRHMELDDAGTCLHLKQIREQLIDPKIVEYGGHMINIAGDEMLVEFNSAAAALRVAIDVQRALDTRNSSLSPGDRIEYRIGINLGDVLVDDSAIAGDGINVAARLAALATPGGICVSGAVHEQVQRSIDVAFMDRGKQHVKNIERPIQVYGVDLDSGRGLFHGNRRKQWRALTKIAWIRQLAIGAAAIGLVGFLAWMPSRLWKTATAVSSPALSVAVLPFASSAATLEDDQFANALTQDLTIALGRAHFARVVSPSLALTYKAKPIDARAAGRELDVRYLVQGEMSRVGGQVMLTVHFIDTSNGMDVWSDRMELDQTRPIHARDELLARLTARLRDSLVDSEQRRTAALSRTDPMVLLLQANAMENRDPNTLRGALAARKLYDEALQLDPDLVPALIGRARTLVYELDLDPHADHDHLIEEMDDLSSRAISIDGNSPLAWVYRAEALWRQWRWEAALEANAKASRLDPTSSAALNQRALIMNNIGRPLEALSLVNRVAALDSRRVGSTGMENLERCIAYMTLDRYSEAIAACEKSAANDDWWLAHLYLTAAYAHDGDNNRVAAEKARLWKQQPRFTISDFKALRYSDNPIYWQQAETHLLSGLRKAGIPEK